MGELSDLAAGLERRTETKSLSDLMRGMETPVVIDETAPGSLTTLFREKGYLAENGDTRRTYEDPEARLRAAAEEYNYLIPEKDCDIPGDGVPSPSEDVSLLMDRIRNISPGLAVAIESAEERGIIVCDIARSKVSYNGFSDPELGIIGINPNAPVVARTAAEELVHSYQDHPRLDINEYTLPDFNLWKMGIEAQAKLSVAVEAVRLKHSSDPDMELFDAHKLRAQFEVSRFLDERVAAEGLSALEDPSVLAEGFKVIMGNKNFAGSYIARFTPGGPLDESVGHKQFDPADFVQHFGTIVGGDPRNNFLIGEITDKQDIIDMLPENAQSAINMQIGKLPSVEGERLPARGVGLD